MSGWQSHGTCWHGHATRKVASLVDGAEWISEHAPPECGACEPGKLLVRYTLAPAVAATTLEPATAPAGGVVAPERLAVAPAELAPKPEPKRGRLRLLRTATRWVSADPLWERAVACAAFDEVVTPDEGDAEKGDSVTLDMSAELPTEGEWIFARLARGRGNEITLTWPEGSREIIFADTYESLHQGLDRVFRDETSFHALRFTTDARFWFQVVDYTKAKVTS